MCHKQVCGTTCVLQVGVSLSKNQLIRSRVSLLPLTIVPLGVFLPGGVWRQLRCFFIDAKTIRSESEYVTPF